MYQFKQNHCGARDVQQLYQFTVGHMTNYQKSCRIIIKVNQSIKAVNKHLSKREQDVLIKFRQKRIIRTSNCIEQSSKYITIPVNDHGVIGNQKLGQIKKEWIKPLVLNEFVVKAKRFSNRHVPYYIRKDGTISMKPI